MVWSRISREIRRKTTKAFLILHHYIFINDIEQVRVGVVLFYSSDSFLPQSGIQFPVSPL